MFLGAWENLVRSSVIVPRLKLWEEISRRKTVQRATDNLLSEKNVRAQSAFFFTACASARPQSRRIQWKIVT